MSVNVAIFIAAAIVMTVIAVALVAGPLLKNRGAAGNAPLAALLIVIAVPLVTLFLYVSVSNHQWGGMQAGQATPVVANLDEAVVQLEQRLAEQPGDAEGWLLLGRSYTQLQRWPDARRAYTKAAALEPSNEAKLGLAEVDIMADRANLTGEAARLVEDVLVSEPDNPKALFYGGMVAMARGDQAAVRDRWGKVLALNPPDNIRQLLEQQLALLDEEGGTASPPDAGAHAIDVRISIDPALTSRIGDGAVVFVLARQPDVQGPPIAAVRVPSAALPTELTISDSDTMLPGRSLGGLDAIEIVARVANGGEPIASTGDLYGTATWTASDANARAVTIDIDRIVE